MDLIKTIINLIHTFWESFISEDDIGQDFRRNYSIHYSGSKNAIKKYFNY